MTRDRLNLIAERPQSFRAELRIKSAQDRQDAEMLSSILLLLVKNIEDNEKPLNLLKKSPLRILMKIFFLTALISTEIHLIWFAIVMGTVLLLPNYFVFLAALLALNA